MAIREPCHAEIQVPQGLDIRSPSFSILGPQLPGKQKNTQPRSLADRRVSCTTATES